MGQTFNFSTKGFGRSSILQGDHVERNIRRPTWGGHGSFDAVSIFRVIHHSIFIGRVTRHGRGPHQFSRQGGQGSGRHCQEQPLGLEGTRVGQLQRIRPNYFTSEEGQGRPRWGYSRQPSSRPSRGNGQAGGTFSWGLGSRGGHGHRGYTGGVF